MTIGDAEAFREAIIGASLELGQAYGEEGVTMRAIAAKLGTSATTLYTCFESKAAIIRELRVRGFSALGNTLLSALSQLNGHEALLEASRRYVGFARDNPWLYALVLVAETPTSEAITEGQRDHLAIMQQEIRQRFGDCWAQASGVTPKNVQWVFARWVATMHGLASMLITGRVTASHAFFPVGDVEGFIRDYVESMVGAIEHPYRAEVPKAAAAAF